MGDDSPAQAPAVACTPEAALPAVAAGKRGTLDAALADALVLAAFVACFWASIAGLNQQWAAFNASYSHGYLVLAMMIYFIWLERGQLLYVAARPVHVVALPLAALSALWGVATIAGVETVGIMILPAVLLGLVLLTRGWTTARRLALPILLLYSAIPFWEDIFALPLRNITASVAAWFLTSFSLFPVLVDGYAFHLRDGTFFIADECNGMSFFVTSITIGLAYGHLNIEGTFRRVAFLLFCMAMSLVSNWVRVISIIYIGHYSAMQSPMVTPSGHLAYGWVLFALAMGVMLFLGYRISAVRPEPDAPGPASTPRAAVGGMTLLMAVLPLLLAPLIAYGHHLLSRPLPAPTLADEFAAIDAGTVDWAGQFTGSPQTTIGTWNSNPDVRVMLVHYGDQRQGNELVAFGNGMAVEDAWTDLQTRQLGPADHPLLRFPVLETELERAAGAGRRLVWHVNVMGGYPAVGRAGSKLAQLRAAILDRRTDATLVAISVACASDCGEAHAILHSTGPSLITRLVANLE